MLVLIVVTRKNIHLNYEKLHNVVTEVVREAATVYIHCLDLSNSHLCMKD